MKIQIYGTGCAKCVKLAENAALAAKQHGGEVEIEKITDINTITEAGVMMTPALGIDGKIVSTGKVLSPEDIAKLLEKPNCECCCSAETTEASTPCCGGDTKGRGKTILTVLLLALVAFSIVAMIVREVKTPVAATATPPIAADVVTVYYFHGNQRCMTCNRIEELTKETVNGAFAEEVANGKVVVRSVNIEAPENEHFIKDFQLSTRSVVMQKDDDFEKFDAVWTLIREPEKFTEYIRDGLRNMLEK